MSIDIERDDWRSIDSWWSIYTRTQSIAEYPTSARVDGMKRLATCWDELDPWWQVHAVSAPGAQSAASARVVGLKRLVNNWDDLDPWWNVYTQTGHETAGEIADLLVQSKERWKSSDAPFDTDPLGVDLSRKRTQRGPLQPSREEEWSRWLAQLLRPSVELITELFDVVVDHPPSEVIREVQLSKQDGGFRRPDILLLSADYGISIEVKLGDENYRKTPETAKLVERHYDERKWVHVLLLPKRKKERLNSIAETPLSTQPNGRLQMEWTDASVDVIYWRDVTAAIRLVLHRGAAVDDHWAANAYLFCAVAEQQILEFQPQPVIERLAAPTNVVDTIQPIQLADTLAEQLTYLEERMDP